MQILVQMETDGTNASQKHLNLDMFVKTKFAQCTIGINEISNSNYRSLCISRVGARSKFLEGQSHTNWGRAAPQFRRPCITVFHVYEYRRIKNAGASAFFTKVKEN